LGSWGFAAAQNPEASCLNRKVRQNPAMPWVLNPAELRAEPNPAAAAAVAGIDGGASLGLLLLLLLLGTLRCLLLPAQVKTSESAALNPAAAAAGCRCCSCAAVLSCLAVAAAR
jgi:hypothetical protein